jgi:hypothetical protein
VIPRVELAPGLSISRVIKGGWHLAGDHGEVDPDGALRDMAAFVDAGITTFDCADIYNGVEELIGRFRRQYPGHAARLRVHTKFVPDLDQLPTVDRAYVERIVDRSLQRLGVEQLDLVQFHWWDCEVPRYVEVALELEQLRRAGKIDQPGDELRHRAAPRDPSMRACRSSFTSSSTRCSTIAPSTGWSISAGRGASRCSRTERWPEGSSPIAGSGARRLPNRSRTARS